MPTIVFRETYHDGWHLTIVLLSVPTGRSATADSVERNDGNVESVVQFFGVIQLVCILGRTDPTIPDAAVIGFLDPIDDIESFTELESLGTQYPRVRTPAILIQNWSEKFETGAAARGATKEVKLSGSVEANWSS